MEKAIYYSKQKISIELTQGKELANQLKNYLDDDNTEKSGEICEFLVEKILSAYEKSLIMLKSSAIKWEESKETPQCFNSDSPRSDISHQSQQKVPKKRKALPQRSEQTRISTGAGVNDGYSWRKYGQKDILGATFPRAYYRCTHRDTQGCLATKQVQMSDENQSMFETTYKGRHTCNQTTSWVSLGKESKKQKKEECTKPVQIQKQTGEMLFNCETSLKTEKLDTMVEIFPSFSFPSTSIETPYPYNYAPTHTSQEASESNYFTLSPCHMNHLWTSQNLQHSGLDNADMLSAPNSLSNSPIGDFDISLDQVEFDPDFPFDLDEFFQ